MPNDSNSVQKEIRRPSSKRLMLLGFGLLMAGFLAILFPLVSTRAVEFVLGVSVLSAGLLHCCNAFPWHRWSLWEIAWGTILLIGGISLASQPIRGLIALTLLIGLVLVMEGVSKVLLGLFGNLDQKRTFLFDGIVGILIGVVVLANLPGDALWVIGTLVGIRFLFAGTAVLSLSSIIRKAVQDN